MGVRLLSVWVLSGLLSCGETTIVECEDQFGNPINCPQASSSTVSATENRGSSSDDSSGTEGSDGASGAGGSVGGSASDGTNGGDTPSCEGMCGSWFGENAACQCDEKCVANEDCCPDYESLCNNLTGTDGSDGDDGSVGGPVTPTEYSFPSPFETELLSYGDCRGIASGNSSYCDSYDCRGIVKRDKGPCTTNDCKGIASANFSWCDSVQCKGIARGYKCLDEYQECTDSAEGSDAKATCEDQKESCQSEARGYCGSHKACKAIAQGDASYCASNDGNCKAIVKKDGSFCFYGDEG